MVINSPSLTKTLGDKPSFKPVNTSIRFLLGFEDPLVPDYIVMERFRTQSPGMIGYQGFVFTCHGFNPFRMSKSLFLGRGSWRQSDKIKAEKRVPGRMHHFKTWKLFWFEVAGLWSNDHVGRGRELLAATFCDLVIMRDIDGREEAVLAIGNGGDEVSDGDCSMWFVG